ncbi:hypothetical protein Trydic_g9683 [Trypoxylus dichotomus]
MMDKVQLTKNIFLITSDKKSISQNKLKRSPSTKPLVIMPTWLMAADKPIFKYAKFYLQHGFDVLNIQTNLWQLLWPVKGTQVLATDILKYLENNRNYAPLIVHGFSIGCYLWGEVLVLIAANRSRYQFVIDNVIGQIWDSPADITRIPAGVSYATFPNSKLLQNALKSYSIYHLNTFHDAATTHYLKSRSLIYNNPIRTPVLVYASKTDPISSEDTIKSICDYWKENGTKVYLKMWDDTTHVSHMHKHPFEYLEELSRYLEEIGVITKQIRFQANL